MTLDRRQFLGAAAGALSAPFVLRGASAADPEVSLKLHHFLGPKAPAQTKMLEPWARGIEQASGGRIKIELYPSMSLGGSPPQLFRQVVDGVVDIVWTVNGYTPNLFPRCEVFELPTIFTNNIAAANLAMREMFATHLAEEYKDVHLLYNHVHAGQAIHMAETPVHHPKDLAGKKLRVPGPTGIAVIEQLGATPVPMPVSDLPQALTTHAVDGALIPWEIIPALKLQDSTKYQIEGEASWRLGTTTFQVSMNKGRWESLPDDLKAVFDKACGEDWLKQVAQIWRDSDDAGIKIATDSGNEHIVLSHEETLEFQTALAPVVDKWTAGVGENGVDGAALVEAARAAIAKHGA
jgi:TRAP-type C4-dicarboxylate transport system substrate-binding protein